MKYFNDFLISLQSYIDNDNSLLSKIWFLKEYVRYYIIMYLQYIVYTKNTSVLQYIYIAMDMNKYNNYIN